MRYVLYILDALLNMAEQFMSYNGYSQIHMPRVTL